MKITFVSRRLLAAGLVGAVAMGAVLPARAVELQQRFVAGQALNYDLAMNGTANLKVPTDAPVIFAGVPLEVEVRGSGVGRFNTLSVDALGNGTVFFELPHFDLNAKAFGQKGLLELRDGQAPRFSLNGKPLAVGDKKNDDKAAPAKRYALIIGKDGRIKDVQELAAIKPTAATLEAPAAPTARRVADEKPVKPEAAIDQSAFFTSVILRALPTLLPQGDVQIGDTWKTSLPFPTNLARAGATADAPPLSQWTMTLKGQETLDGAALWRIGVIGGLRVDGDRLPAPAPPGKDARPVMQLDNLTQNVNGDFWFDAQNGRIARGDFVVDARGQGHTLDNKGGQSEPSWADFTGTFGMKLNTK